MKFRSVSAIERALGCRRPEGPVVNSLVRQGVVNRVSYLPGPKGRQSISCLPSRRRPAHFTAGPSDLKTFSHSDPRPNGRGYLLSVLRTYVFDNFREVLIKLIINPTDDELEQSFLKCVGQSLLRALRPLP